MFYIAGVVPIDDFKRETMDMVTGWDLIGCPVHYRSPVRRKLLKMV